MRPGFARSMLSVGNLNISLEVFTISTFAPPCWKYFTLNHDFKRACRSHFQLFQHLSCETLSFRNHTNQEKSHRKTQAPWHAIISGHGNDWICHEFSNGKLVSFIISRILAAEGLQNSKTAFSPCVPLTFFFACRLRRAPHFCFFSTPLVWERWFCECLLSLCCWRPGFSPSTWFTKSFAACLNILI